MYQLTMYFYSYLLIFVRYKQERKLEIARSDTQGRQSILKSGGTES